MKPRRAFTLLELIVSIAVAGIIALIAYGSATAGLDTRDALARYRRTAEAELRSRVLIGDALRHASDETVVRESGTGAGEPADGVFDLVDAMDPRGLPLDRLTFLTRGVLPPLGATGLWVMSLSPSPRGLIVGAAPSGVPGAGGMTATVPAVHGLEVETMSLADRTWTTTWPSAGQLPAAVRLTFYDAAGALVGPPMVVRLGLEGVR